MSGRTKRRRLNAETAETLVNGATAYVSSVSNTGLWNGFCEIESEPVSKVIRSAFLIQMTSIETDTEQALFNVMLREFGVEGIKVQEVVSLDEGMMALLPYVCALLSIRLLINATGGPFMA